MVVGSWWVGWGLVRLELKVCSWGLRLGDCRFFIVVCFRCQWGLEDDGLVGLGLGWGRVIIVGWGIGAGGLFCFGWFLLFLEYC